MELGVAMRNRIYFSNDHAAPWWNEWDSNHLYGISARLNLNNAGRKDWGVFSLGNGTHEAFCFRGNRDRWGPIWEGAYFSDDESLKMLHVQVRRAAY
ncbi:hypothetical protein GBA52_020203 [Prunus armeniaca]|nr:hypothetical protein GBA52_020203 [Prunus armeniaca]